ncbi:MAG TPA: hypothetical protein VH109_09065 [Steroidobacteraceae bacterium]|jgi:hypothetical protein|nr:hypothetical protein [Steroidobacteraceae bacterium]
METMYEALRRLWRPGEEALGALGDVLTEHWRETARIGPQLFAAGAPKWLRTSGEPVTVAVRPHHAASGGRLIR